MILTSPVFAHANLKLARARLNETKRNLSLKPNEKASSRVEKFLENELPLILQEAYNDFSEIKEVEN